MAWYVAIHGMEVLGEYPTRKEANEAVRSVIWKAATKPDEHENKARWGRVAKVTNRHDLQVISREA